MRYVTKILEKSKLVWVQPLPEHKCYLTANTQRDFHSCRIVNVKMPAVLSQEGNTPILEMGEPSPVLHNVWKHKYTCDSIVSGGGNGPAMYLYLPLD